MDSTVHGGGVVPAITERVYYTGSDTLLEGYALCYNFDASDVSAENLTLSAGVDEECSARRLQVEKPNLNNCVHFAGVVSAKSAGMVGPGWLEINKPGSVCNIYCNASADHGTTGTAMNSGQILTFTLDSYSFVYQGVGGSGAAMVLQDVDRSTTAGLVMAELMTGMPSGGAQVISSLHTTGVVSAGGVVCIAPFGVTILDSTPFTVALDLTAALTACLVATEGKWIGQTKRFVMTTSCGANGVVLTVSTSRDLSASVLTVKTPNVATVSMVPDNSACTATWNGDAWVVMVNSSIIAVTYA